MFREALGYPTRPPRGGRAVLVGGTLLLLVGAVVGVASLDTALAPVALVALPPWLLARGYYVRVVRSTLGRDHPAPPGFGDAGRLLRDGAAAAGVAAGYLLPPVAVLAPLVYARTRDTDVVTLLLGEGASPAVAGALTAAAGVVALFALFALIGALYVLPVGVANYAASGRLRAAFDLRTVASGAATEDYVVAWGVSLLLQALFLPVAYLLKPLLVGFYVHFVVAVAVRYCYGRGVGAALDVPPIETAFEGPTDEPAGTDLRPAVRPIETSAVLEPRSSGAPGRGDSREDRGECGAGDRQRGDPDADERPERERPEGERT